MSETALYYFEKARRCRRLAGATNDEQAVTGLTALAEELEIKAKAALVWEHTMDSLVDGVLGRLNPHESCDPT